VGDGRRARRKKLDGGVIFSFKIYSTLEPIPLPHEIPPSTGTALDATSATGVSTDGDRIPDHGVGGTSQEIPLSELRKPVWEVNP